MIRQGFGLQEMDVPPSRTITDAINQAIEQAANGIPCVFVHNSVVVVAYPGDSVDTVTKRWEDGRAERDRLQTDRRAEEFIRAVMESVTDDIESLGADDQEWECVRDTVEKNLRLAITECPEFGGGE